MTIQDMTMRLGAALVVGMLLGTNRDLHGKSAGIRTLGLVSLGAALAVAFSADGFGMDGVTRTVQGVMAGIGFLGAGVIIHHPGNERVQGLTTAASVWMAATLGAACGAAQYALVGVASVLALVLLVLGGPLERALQRYFGNGAACDETPANAHPSAPRLLAHPSDPVER
jgi:putative Mg2+ transporter-C (MgtC) family protein